MSRRSRVKRTPRHSILNRRSLHKGSAPVTHGSFNFNNMLPPLQRVAFVWRTKTKQRVWSCLLRLCCKRRWMYASWNRPVFEDFQEVLVPTVVGILLMKNTSLPWSVLVSSAYSSRRRIGISTHRCHYRSERKVLHVKTREASLDVTVNRFQCTRVTRDCRTRHSQTLQ